MCELTQNDKTKSSRFYDLRIERYKKLKILKNLFSLLNFFKKTFFFKI